MSVNIIPTLGDSEPGRIEVLKRYQILDTPPEELYDDIAEMAARVCGVAVAMIGFIDSSRQWFKSKAGWQIAHMPRQIAFCNLTIQQRDLLVIEDTQKDPRFANHPLVLAEPHIRFYAGVPILTPERFAIGSLCLYDRVPRQIDDHHRQTLRALARQIGSHLEHRRSLSENHFGSRDVDELREALAESEDRFRDLFENAYDLVVSISADGRILHTNGAFASALGYLPEKVSRRSIVDLVSQDAKKDLSESFARVIASCQPETVETVFETSDGRRIIAEGRLNPKVINGSSVLARVIFRDISERKRIAAELERTRDEALEAARLKSQFLTNVSHEVRTPMNAIVGMMELLLDSPLNSEQVEYAKTALASADSLLSLINNILYMSKLESGKLTLAVSDFDPVKTIEQVADVMRVATIGKELEIRTEIDPSIPAVLRGDARRIRMVLSNIMGNAIKFTPSGSVVLQIQRERETETHTLVRFSVTDTGIGIPEQARSRLFKIFTQVDGSMTREHSGVGLGLATSKSLVELMGGVIGVESQMNRGSTFWFTIPFEKRPAEKVSGGHSRVSLAGANALVVDLSETHRKIVQRYLSGWGMRYSFATDGSTALSMMKDAATSGDPFAVAIFDLHMPAIDGVMLAKSIKSEAAIAPTGLVLMTALGVQLDEKMTRDLGISAYLPKPVEQSELFDCVTMALVKSGRAEARPEVLVPDATPEVKRSAAQVETPRRVRVLLAEDNHLNQKLTLSQLQKLGYPADAVRSGAEAVAAIQSGEYGIVLMDCQMPEMDGYQATMEIRRREGDKRQTRIIALTAHALDGDREKCLAAGMDDYLSKPTRQEELGEVLSRWAAAEEEAE